MNEGSQVSCPIPLKEVEEYYKQFFGNKTIEDFSAPPCHSDDIDDSFQYDHLPTTPFMPDVHEITEKEVLLVMKKMKIGTSPGPDGISLRVLKHLNTAKFISLLGTAMLRIQKIPTEFKKARTILIFKGGDPKDIKNWRPITIFSIVRRITLINSENVS